ncbi:MAG: hypothetical protein ACREBP_06925, partial [Sphingomicrobium sp.]
AKFARWLWQRSRIWIRMPLAIAFVVGGFLSFLPILSVWMLPLGPVLVPFLQEPMARMLA